MHTHHIFHNFDFLKIHGVSLACREALYKTQIQSVPIPENSVGQNTDSILQRLSRYGCIER